MATQLGGAFGRAFTKAKKRANKIDYVGLAKQQFLLEGVKGITNLLVTPAIAGTKELAKDIFVDPYTEKRANFLANGSQRLITDQYNAAVKEQADLTSLMTESKRLGTDAPIENYMYTNNPDLVKNIMSQNALKKDASPIDLAELSADEQKNVFISFLRNTEAGKEALKSTVNEIERKVKVALPTERSFRALKQPSNMFTALGKGAMSFFKKDFDEQAAVNNLVKSGAFKQEGAKDNKRFKDLKAAVTVLNNYTLKDGGKEKLTNINSRVAAHSLFYEVRKAMKDQKLVDILKQVGGTASVNKEYVIENGALLEQETVEYSNKVLGDGKDVTRKPVLNFSATDRVNEQRFVSYLQQSNMSIPSMLAQFGNNSMPKYVQNEVARLYKQDPDFWAAPSSEGKRPVDITSQDMTYNQFIGLKKIIIDSSDTMLFGKKAPELEVEIHRESIEATMDILKKYSNVRDEPDLLADYEDSWMFENPKDRLSPLNSSITMTDAEGRTILNEDYIKKTNPNKAREADVLRHANTLFVSYKTRMSTLKKLKESMNVIGRLQESLYRVAQGKSDISYEQITKDLLTPEGEQIESSVVIDVPFGKSKPTLLGKQ